MADRIPLIVDTADGNKLKELPIGDNFTMGYKDAIIASDFLKCNKILGYHFDTFGLIEIDQAKAIDEFKRVKKELLIIKPMEHITI